MSAPHTSAGAVVPAVPVSVGAAVPAPAPARSAERFALASFAAGGLLCALALREGGIGSLAPGYLLAFVFCWSVVLGSLFFVALQHATRSVWSVVLRRVAEMLAAPVGLLAILFLPLLVTALVKPEASVFPWMDPDAVHADHALEKKAAYLNPGAFTVRMVAFFVIWGISSAFFVGRSLRQDDGRAGAGATLRMRSFSAPFLILFAFTVTFASFDWLMSLAPHWYSTIFGVYVFGGMTVTALAAITATVVGMRASGRIPANLVRKDHLYSLGALLFAFTCFWAYIAFSQYMLIWYGNIPEETVWFIDRMRGGWGGVTVLLAFLRFVIPFLLLLPRSAKTDPVRLGVASGVVILGQLVDLFWLIVPETGGPVFRVGAAEVGPLLLFLGVMLLAFSSFLRRHRAVPVGDPLLEKSAHFHL